MLQDSRNTFWWNSHSVARAATAHRGAVVGHVSGVTPLLLNKPVNALLMVVCAVPRFNGASRKCAAVVAGGFQPSGFCAAEPGGPGHNTGAKLYIVPCGV